MRTALLLLSLAALALTSCQRAENKPENANVNANHAPDPAPAPGAPKPVPERLAPAHEPPKEAPADVKEVLAVAAQFGGYENRAFRRAGDPLHIHFNRPGLKDADLETMRPVLLRSVVPIKLNLNGCESITDAGIAHLRGVHTIRVLQIESKQFTDEGMQHLAGHMQLEELTISGAVTDAGLAHLAKLTNLKKLSIYSKGTTDAGYAHLAGFINLEELHVGDIGHEMGDVCLGHMKGMTKLKKINLSRDKLTDAGMAHVKNFTEVSELKIESSGVTGAALVHLAPLRNLQKLTIAVSGLTGDSLAHLTGLAELRELELRCYPYSLDKLGAAHIGKLTRLKKFKPGRVKPGALEGLAGLTALEELTLGHPLEPDVGDDDMKHVGALTSLRALYIPNTRVTDAGIKHLTGLTKLQTFTAEYNNLTDAALPHIAALVSLERLGLTNCKVTGSGLKELAKLTKLERIWLNGNPVTDEHVMALKDVRNLKWVNLTGSRVSDEVFLELKKARPKLELMDAAGDDVELNKKPPPPARAVEDLSKEEPEFKLTAVEFYKEYEADKDAAAKKYKGKVIELSGEAVTVWRSGPNERHIELKSEKQFSGIRCEMADPMPWAKVLKGQAVKLKGKWPASPYQAMLIDCALVEAGEYKAIAITAVELAKEYATDPEAAQKKYQDKYLVISGEVTAKEFNSAGAATIELKTDGKVKVTCIYTASEKDVTKPMKVGQKIKAVGEFQIPFREKNAVEVYLCLPLTTP
jgi:Leucine-rich repeat (LRR) protein/uncharacterized protein (DUF1330 family)